jgi:hypothetical protein
MEKNKMEFGIQPIHISILLCLILPVLVILILFIILTMQRKNTKKCPFCAEKIIIDAKVCKYCKRDL